MKSKLFSKVFRPILSFCLFLILPLLFSSCEVFVKSVQAYLEKYSKLVQFGDVIPEVNYETDKNGKNCISSSKDGDFIFYVTFANPADHEVQLKYRNAGETNWDDVSEAGGIPYLVKPADGSCQYKLYFDKNYIKNKDKPGADRNIKLDLCFVDKTINQDGIIHEENNDDSGFTKIITLDCNVNTKPDIIYDDGSESSPTTGTYSNASSNCTFLCFNLKPESYSCFYDDLKDTSGKYKLNINGTDYTFKFVSGKPVFDSDSFKYSTADFDFKKYDDSDFQNLDNPIYFLAGSKMSAFNILVTDEEGLKATYIVSGEGAGKYKLQPPSETLNNDVIEISTDCRANAINGGGSITATGVYVEYTIDGGATQKVNVSNGGAEISLPGGNRTVKFRLSCDNSDIQASEYTQKSYTLPNKLYVSTSPNSMHNGGSSYHPTSLTKAVKYLNGQNGNWELYLASGTYTATENDMVTGSEDYNTWIHITGPSKVTIKGPASNNRATINANKKGRVLSTNNTELEIENVNFTGGLATEKNGGGIYANKTISLKNCDVYENKATRNGQNTGNGGGMYVAYGNLSLEGCKLYGNDASGAAGGAVYHTGAEVKTLYVKSTTIGDIDKPNKASEGGGMLLNFPKSGSTITFEDSLIGSETVSDADKFANIATSSSTGGGGIMIHYGTDPDGDVIFLFKNTKIMKNKASTKGGGIYICQKKTVNFDYDCEVSYNKAGNGGGIFLEYDPDNSGNAIVKLGDVDNDPKSADNKMQVNNNEAYSGAAIYCSQKGAVYVKNTWIKNNITTKDHGYIIYFEPNVYFYNWSDPNTITEIKDNTDNQNGYVYGIYFQSTMEKVLQGQSNKFFNFLDMSDNNYLNIPSNSQSNSVLKEFCFTWGSPHRVVTSNFTLVSTTGTTPNKKHHYSVLSPSLSDTNIASWDPL